MITAYRARDAHPPTDPGLGDGRPMQRRESDHVSWEFERVRSLMIEGTAKEFGLEPVRRRGGPVGSPGPNRAGHDPTAPSVVSARQALAWRIEPSRPGRS